MSKSPRAAAASRLVKPTWTKRGSAAEALGEQLRDLDVEADDARGIGGSASTNGAPPSASPPQRSSAICACLGGQSTAVQQPERAHRIVTAILRATDVNHVQSPWTTSRLHRARGTSLVNHQCASGTPKRITGCPIRSSHGGCGARRGCRSTATSCVLDVGCGTGRLTEQLLERLPRGRVVAIDLSAEHAAARRADIWRRDSPARSASRRRTPRRCRSRGGPTPSSAPRRFTGCSITRRSSAACSRRSSRAAGWWRSAAAGPTSSGCTTAATC